MTTETGAARGRLARCWHHLPAWRNWRISWRDRLVLAVLGGLVALGQAPFSLWFLAVPALVVLLALLARPQEARRSALAALFAGAGYFAVALFWIVEPFFVDFAKDGWMAPFALPMMAFGMALFWAVPLGVLRRLVPGAHRWLPLLLGLGIALGETGRSYLLTGFPWTLVGHIWIGTPVAQLAAWIGPLGLTGMTLLLAGLAAALPLRAGPVAVVLLAAGWGAGSWRLAQPEPLRDGPAPVIRIAQPNATQSLKWEPGMARLFFQRLLDETARPTAGGGRPDLVVWPETAVPWLLNDAQPVLDMISRAAAGVPMAFGIQRAEGARYYNSLAVMDASGQVTQVYDKYHLVPFGEYMPLGDLLGKVGISAFAAQSGHGYSPGPGPRLLDLGRLGHVLPLICYEAVFPQDVNAAPKRPDWLLQITNDAWFGTISGPYQHLAQARLRAIEQGLPLVRAANTGISAMIDAHGRITGELPMDTEAVLDLPLPVALPATLYSQTGDVPEIVILIVALGALTVALRRRRD